MRKQITVEEAKRKAAAAHQRADAADRRVKDVEKAERDRQLAEFQRAAISMIKECYGDKTIEEMTARCRELEKQHRQQKQSAAPRRRKASWMA